MWNQLEQVDALKMEPIHSSEKSVHTIYTRRHIPEEGILHSHRREKLKSYINMNYTPNGIGKLLLTGSDL
jgi:hypothetical protein